MHTYSMEIAGLKRELPICRVTDDLYIGAFICFGDAELTVACGIYAARSVHSAEGFSLGGRSAGVPLVAGSIAGTCVGGGATIGTAQLASTVGLSAWWFTIGVGLALIIMGIFYARPLRRSSLETIPQYLVQLLPVLPW